MLSLFGRSAVLRETSRGTLAVEPRRLSTNPSPVAARWLCRRPISGFFSIVTQSSSLRDYCTSTRCVKTFDVIPVRLNHTSSSSDAAGLSSNPDPALLPSTCPGCGAFSQWLDADKAGYYNPSRRSVKQFLEQCSLGASNSSGFENATDPSTADSTVNSDETAPSSEGIESKEHGQDLSSTSPVPDTPVSPPVCDRCHNLINHNVASSIACPSLPYVKDLVDESPHQYNHIYHIIDAADFPLSLIPNLHKILGLQYQRSLNRRSQTTDYASGGRRPKVSFIITRSDLLAATKEQVDHLMPYVTDILRKQLDLSENLRFGNLHMVSAYRGWWTRELKEQIKHHGGGVWMVGKTNVGKSSLMSVIFPKSLQAPKQRNQSSPRLDTNDSAATFDQNSLLPPPQPKMQYPVFPITSPIPGTTASPVRVPFANDKGEVIDLPGLSRGSLLPYVRDDGKDRLVMRKRMKAKRLTIKPSQSLLLGGLVQIKNIDPDYIIMAAPFVHLNPHITSSEKASALLRGERSLPWHREISIAKEGVNGTMASAGMFSLDTDVTRTYDPDQSSRFGTSLPYIILSTDVLIEGCGWVELIVQVRKRRLEEGGAVPRVEILSPHGQCIGTRSSMCAYSFIMEKEKMVARRRTSRPKKSMRRARLTGSI